MHALLWILVSFLSGGFGQPAPAEHIPPIVQPADSGGVMTGG